MRRLALLLTLILAACGGDEARAPFADSRIPPALAPRFHPPEGWAWGLVQVGDNPPQRYGVATTPTTPRTHVLVLTGYGESAEAWFETVRDLNGRGYTVWVLERAGQGGSGRSSPIRDLGHVTSFAPDIAAVLAMQAAVIRPAADQPLIVLGHADGALVALSAVQAGLAADGLILSSPRLDDAALRKQTLWPGLGWLKAPGSHGWSREAPDAFAQGLTGDRARGAVQKQWQLANPDLRMGGPSLGWNAAFIEAADAFRPNMVRMPVLVLTTQTGTGCGVLPACVEHRIQGAKPALHLERDKMRLPWVEALDAFARKRIDARRPALPAHAPSAAHQL